MIDVIEILVSINGAKATMLEEIYSNNANQYRALIKFEDDSWNNYDKMIVFDRVKNYDTPIGIMVEEDNKELIEIIDQQSFYCVIPWEVLTQPGYFTISIHGALDNNQKSLTIKNKFTIYDGGNTTIYPRVPTPNMYEQLLEKVKEVSNKVDINTKSDAGRTTPEGGEIFNDYENNRALAPYTSVKGYENTAGGRAFKVLNINRENKTVEEALIDNVSIINEYDVVFNNVSLEENTNYRLILKGSIYNNKYTSNINENIISIPEWREHPLLNDVPLILSFPEIYYDVGTLYDNDNYSAGFILINSNSQNNIDFIIQQMSGNGWAKHNLSLSISKIITSNMFLINICDTTGIEIGDKVSIYSITTKKVYSDCGTITNIDANIITIENLPEEVLSLKNNDITHIYFSNKLELNGDIILGMGASAEGGSVVDDNDGRTYYNKSIGVRSHVEGSGNLSLNYDTHVEGSLNIASGNQAHAGGYRTISTGYQTFTMGNGTEADGHQALATGSNTKATGQQSSAFGSGTEASGNQSDAKGSGTKAIGGQSSAKGYKTEATGEQSDAAGHSTKATAGRAHAGGLYSNAMHNQSFVHGTRLETGADSQFVVGKYNGADSGALFIVGNGSPQYGETVWSDPEGYRSNAFTVNADGTASVQSADIDRYNAVVSSGLLKSYVNSFYYDKIVPNLIGKKYGTGVILNNDNNKVGQFSVATGYLTKAVGEHSLTIGHSTETNGARSFAGGLYSFANGGQSFVHGTRLIANANDQFVIGKFNKEDTNAVFIVGWGTGDTWNGTTRNGKNIFSIQTDGTALIGNTNINIDNAAVTSKLLKEYVSENGKSPWDSQSEMLFSGKYTLTINNAAFGETNPISYPSINIKSPLYGNYQLAVEDFEIDITPYHIRIYDNNNFNGVTLTSNGEIKISGAAAYGDNSITLNRGEITDIDTDWDSMMNEPVITKKSITWKDLFTTVNKFKYINLTDYVKNTDYATNDKAGLVRPTNGLTIIGKNNDGIGLVAATNTYIDSRTKNIGAITPSNLDYAVKVGITTNTEVLTDEEKNNAQEWLGIKNYVNDDGLTYNGNTISWNRLFAAIEKVESLVDVSTNGQ